MKRTLLLIALATLLLPKWILAQAPVDYRDVAVIVNTNSKTSLAIGNYFMAQRKIPAGNLIKYSGSTTETVSSSSFDSARTAIETSLKKLSGINYLVTTKGCPLRIDRGGTFCDLGASQYIYDGYSRELDSSYCSSFESELMLILGKYSSEIGKADVVIGTSTDTTVNEQPYFEKPGHFSNKEFDIYLVTRLDGSDSTGVKTLIDRSGPNTYTNKSTAQFVFDDMKWYEVAMWASGDTMLHNSFRHAYDLLTKRGWNVYFDSTEKLVNNQKNVIGFLTWGATDTAYKNYTKKKYLANEFLPASIGSIYYSYTGKTLSTNGTGYRFSAGPFLASKLTGVATHVYEPIDFAFIIPTQLFGKYTDSTMDRRFNLAEAYYAGSSTMSWMTTIIGDPKTSIITAIPAKPSVTVDTITKICEGKSRVINSSGNLPGNYNWFSTDSTTLKASGSYMDSTNTHWVASGKSFSIPTNLKPGKYTYTYVNENISGRSFKEVTFNVVVCTGVDAVEIPKARMEIYPNPAHNMFTVSYEGLNYQQAVLIITDALGREVYTENFSNATDLKQNINLNGKPSGIYFISLTTGNQRLVSKLILK